MIEKAHDLPPADDGDIEAGERGAAEQGDAEALLAARSGAVLPVGDAADDDTAADDESDGLGAEASAASNAESGSGAASSLPLAQRIEALLFASGQPLTPARLANVLEVEVDAVNVALSALVAAWRERAGAVDLIEIAGGFRFMTRRDFHVDVAGLRGKVGTERLSPAALETLAVVAYRQPIGRAEVEAVRGVQVGPVLRLLLDRDLIRITGRSTDPGHPLLYGTTKRFLDHFGLKSLKALPDLKDLLESP